MPYYVDQALANRQTRLPLMEILRNRSSKSKVHLLTNTIIFTFHTYHLLRYKTEFGFSIDGRPIIVDDIRVRGIAKTGIKTIKTLPAATSPAIPVTVKRSNSPDNLRQNKIDKSFY